MCGIAGVLVFDGGDFQITEKYLIRMRDTMAHRGPDGAGVWISRDGKVGLGHRRLSIIDISDAAAQPMSNEDGSLWISYNGEIYNYAELRTALEKGSGHHWRTDHSDTEVIIHAYEEWGIDCIHKFRGIFAFALWDGRNRRLWLVRDRVGVKPLYYSVHNGRVVFASEIKALLVDSEQKRAVDEEAFYHFLTFLTSPPGRTLFAGIKKLKPGTRLCINPNGVIQEQKYWDALDFAEPFSNLSEDETAAMILDELRSSVRYRKVSDVPVGVFLSGGIDSSCNTSLFSEGETEPVKTFTIGYNGHYQTYENEFKYARLIARQVGARYHEHLLEVGDLIDFLPRMIYLQDEPIADPVCVPLYYVSKLARDSGVTVCQVGEGSDELFCGYPFWKEQLRLQAYDRYPFPQFLKKIGLYIGRFLGGEDTVKYEFLRRSLNKQPVFWGGAIAFTEIQKDKLLSKNFKRRIGRVSSWDVIAPLWLRFNEKTRDEHPLQWMSYLDLNFRLPELLLMRVDKMSMGVSLEARVPFLDHKFVEVVMGIPASMKIKRGELKYLLKKAVRGIVPEVLINRKKQGFAIPIYEWFFEELGDVAFTEIKKFCDRTDFFNYEEIKKIFARNEAQKIWYILNFVLWWNKFIEGSENSMSL